MVRLACHECNAEGRPVSLKDISKEEGISLSYLEQLFVKLRRGNLVKSVRGPGRRLRPCQGLKGYKRRRGDNRGRRGINPVACLDTDSEECEKSNTCITQNVWKGLGDKIKEFLNSISIEDLAHEVINLKRQPTRKQRNRAKRSLRGRLVHVTKEENNA